MQAGYVEQHIGANSRILTLMQVAVENNLTHAQALSLVSSTVDSLLGIRIRPADADLVATRGGGLLEFEGKVVGIVSPRVGGVDLFEI